MCCVDGSRCSTTWRRRRRWTGRLRSRKRRFQMRSLKSGSARSTRKSTSSRPPSRWVRAMGAVRLQCGTLCFDHRHLNWCHTIPSWDCAGLEEGEELDPAKQRIQALFDKLSVKLDALTNFHYTPKPVMEEIKIKTNGDERPAISYESCHSVPFCSIIGRLTGASWIVVQSRRSGWKRSPRLVSRTPRCSRRRRSSTSARPRPLQTPSCRQPRRSASGCAYPQLCRSHTVITTVFGNG